MRKFLPLLALSVMFLSGCESERTIDGKSISCIGIGDDPAPGVIYKVSTRNVVVAVVFSETIFVPIVVALNETKCPISVVPVAPTIKPR